MSSAGDAIFDIVRSICTIASAKISVDVTFRTWADLFQGVCPQCMGHGTMVCRFCEGSNTVSRRPARAFYRRALGKGGKEVVPKAGNEDPKYLAHRIDPNDTQSCGHCGPVTLYDTELDLFDESSNANVEAQRISENFNAATAGKPILPWQWSPTAGTVPCDLCLGSRVLHRHTPNLERYCNLEPDFFAQVHARAGAHWSGFFDREQNDRITFLEFANHAPLPDSVRYAPRIVHSILGPAPKDPRDENNETESLVVTKKDLYSVDEYVLPQVTADRTTKVHREGKSFP